MILQIKEKKENKIKMKKSELKKIIREEILKEDTRNTIKDAILELLEHAELIEESISFDLSHGEYDEGLESNEAKNITAALNKVVLILEKVKYKQIGKKTIDV